MRRGRSGIGTELVPLVLILASLAGSLALVIAIHRRFVIRSSAEKLSVAVVASPLPAPVKPKPIPKPSPTPPEPQVDELEPAPPPSPEDPTPKFLAKLMAAEADQLLEASRADRKAAELEAARKAALLESERWRRRESLVRQQLDTLETKVHQIETRADEMALERDALETEVDARKALAAQARSRPSTAILPHRGQNGTWRRPIVVECVNGMAIIRPQNLGFGLLELSMGFGPTTNPFVATVAREAIRIQGNASPDGQTVTPYIFFLVRPDGIRTYYEARGRLESLGITFGYELADQDWEIDFPDLDDVKSWDGSTPVSKTLEPLARSAPYRSAGMASPNFDNLPDLGPSTGTGQSAQAQGAGAGSEPGSEFTWPPKPKANSTGGRVSLGRTGTRPDSGRISNSSGNGNAIGGGSTEPSDSSGGGVKFPGGTSGVTTDPATGNDANAGTLLTPPRELNLGGPITPLVPGSTGNPGTSQKTSGSSNPGSFPPAPSNGLGQGSSDSTSGRGAGSPPPPDSTSNGSGSGSLPQYVSPRNPPTTGMGQSLFASSIPNTNAASTPAQENVNHPNDPANAYVFPSPSGLESNPANQSTSDGSTSPSPISPNQTPLVRHLGPFSRPLAGGLDPSLMANASNLPPSSTASPDNTDPTQPDSTNPGTIGNDNPSQSSSSANSSNHPNSNQKPGTAGAPPSQVLGPGDNSSPPQDPGSPPPPLTIGLGSPGSAPSSPPPPLPFGMTSSLIPPPPSSNPPNSQKPKASPPTANNHKIYDKRYEIVVVCGAKGVIVQPGSYRVTADALKDREGLLKNQIVALVKAKKTAEPKQSIEPTIRFLVQPGGESTFWMARSQFLISGLNWPMTTQVADRDHLTILPSESW